MPIRAAPQSHPAPPHRSLSGPQCAGVGSVSCQSREDTHFTEKKSKAQAMDKGVNQTQLSKTGLGPLNMSSSDIESTGVKNPSTHLFTPTSFRSPEGDLQTRCPQQAASHQDTKQGWSPNPEPERTSKKPLRRVCPPSPRGGDGQGPLRPCAPPLPSLGTSLGHNNLLLA